MAELLLLLIFCLLLVAAAAIQHKDSEISALSQLLPAAAAHPPGTPPLLAPADASKPDGALGSPSGAATPDKNWHELVLAQNYLDAVRKAGGTADSLDNPALVEATAQLAKALPAGASPAEIATMLRDYAALKQAGLADISSRDLVSALTGSGPDANGHNWPPIITLNDDGFSFEINSAELTPQFRQRLETSVTQQVLDLIRRYHTDVVEVVGHTDEQPIHATRTSTLDTDAISAMSGSTPIDDLIPADNAGLGLARAIAVAQALEATGKLQGVKVLPLSGAQMIMPGDRLADGSESGDNSNRRRIEIRVRRSAGASQ